MIALFLGLALAQSGFQGTIKELELNAGGGIGGAPEGMFFIVPPGINAEAVAGPLSDGAVGAKLTVRQPGDALMCTQSVQLGPQAFVRARLKVPEITPGGGSWMGMNLELRARDAKGNLVSPPGVMYTLVQNIREPVGWTDVEGRVQVPVGATQGEVCLRFVLSTGTVELDRIQVVSRADGAAATAASAPAPAAAPAPAPAPAVAPAATPAPYTAAPAPAATAAAAATTVTTTPQLAAVSAVASPTNDGSQRGFTLRVAQRASSVACSKWVPTSGPVTVLGTVDVTAVNPDAVDWSGLAIEAFARDAQDRPVLTGGVPYAPLYVTTVVGAGQKFSVKWTPPPGTNRARFCTRFSDAAGSVGFDWQ